MLYNLEIKTQNGNYKFNYSNRKELMEDMTNRIKEVASEGNFVCKIKKN